MIIDKITIESNKIPGDDGLLSVRISFWSGADSVSEIRKVLLLEDLDIASIIDHKNSCCMSIPENVVIEQ